MTKEDFVLLMWKACPPDMQTDSRLFVVAHAALESGWGTAKAFTLGNNPFNITRPGNPHVVHASDEEYEKDGTVKKIVQSFGAFPSLVDSVTYYLSFIGRARYGKALELLREGKDSAGFVSELKHGGYFTSPLADYIATFANILHSCKAVADQQNLV